MEEVDTQTIKSSRIPCISQAGNSGLPASRDLPSSRTLRRSPPSQANHPGLSAPAKQVIQDPLHPGTSCPVGQGGGRHPATQVIQDSLHQPSRSSRTPCTQGPPVQQDKEDVATQPSKSSRIPCTSQAGHPGLPEPRDLPSSKTGRRSPPSPFLPQEHVTVKFSSPAQTGRRSGHPQTHRVESDSGLTAPMNLSSTPHSAIQGPCLVGFCEARCGRLQSAGWGGRQYRNIGVSDTSPMWV